MTLTTLVSSLGLDIGWYPYPGASNYVIQSRNRRIVPQHHPLPNRGGEFGHHPNIIAPRPRPNRIIHEDIAQKGAAFGYCNNTWHIKTDQKATVRAMKRPRKWLSFPI